MYVLGIPPYYFDVYGCAKQGIGLNFCESLPFRIMRYLETTSKQRRFDIHEINRRCFDVYPKIDV